MNLKRLLIVTVSVVFLGGCVGTFKNHKNESFPFSIQIYQLPKPAPTVLVSHGSACLQQQYYDWAAQLNSWGYNAIVIDHCTARGVQRYTGGLLPKNLIPEDKATDYLVLAEWVRLQPWHTGKVGVIGFSRGGGGVTRLADPAFQQRASQQFSNPKAQIDAGVAFYPACSPFPPPPNPVIPVQIHHGAADNLSFPKRCGYQKLKSPNYEIWLYEGAHHTFDDLGPDVTGTNLNGEPFIARRYNKDADKQSREYTKAFLDRYLRN